jgi:hypothetical protein
MTSSARPERWQRECEIERFGGLAIDSQINCSVKTPTLTLY